MRGRFLTFEGGDGAGEGVVGDESRQGQLDLVHECARGAAHRERAPHRGDRCPTRSSRRRTSARPTCTTPKTRTREDIQLPR